MPRTRWRPETDAPLLDAVFDPAKERGFTPYTQMQIQDVRAVFAERMRWSRERLSRYRFRVLASVSRRESEVVLAVLKPPADVLPTLPEALLEQHLAHMSDLPLESARAHFHELFTAKPEVIDIADHYRITLTRSDYARAREVARMLGLNIRSKDAREGNPDLSRLVSKLLEVTHERLQ